MKRTTSLRLSEELRDQLAVAAEQHDTTVTALVERFAREGLAIESHPGIVFKPGPGGRRAALAGGPDVWEVVAALRTSTGTEQKRVATAAEQLGIHPRQVTIALGYATDHPDEIERRITANEAALAQAEQAHRSRQRLLDSA
jgi:hypothetical protein